MSRHARDTAIAMDRSEQDSGPWKKLAVQRVVLTSLLAGILLLGVVSVAVNTAQAEPPPGNWALILNEEFSANGLNTALWTPEWPNEPMSGECTSPSLVSQPGNEYLYLQVRAQESTCGGTKHADTGALVESNPADGKPGHTGFLYSYGYVEWKVFIVGWGGEGQGCPKGGCIPDWPALWSFPENQENEIDTMEGLRREACHTWWHHVSPVEEIQGCQSSGHAGWHTYGADWEPGVLKFYYDGVQVGEVKSGYINSTPQYLIMDDVPPNGHGDQLVVPDEIVVDYVRVWQHPVAPSAATGSATSVQPLQATLNGTVNPNGFDTHYYFQYGTTPSYGSTTGEVDAGSGGSAVPASATVGLSPGTTYHYRIVATNTAEETSYGTEQTFTTPGPVEAVTTSPSGITEEEAHLNGTVNPRGYEAKYYFQYGITTSYGTATPESSAGAGTSPVPESSTVVLAAGMTYHYRIVATGGGVTSYGSDVTVTAYSPPSVTVDGLGQRWYAVEGSSNSLDMYWENLKGEPFGPRTLAGKGTTYSAPVLAVDKEGQRWYSVEGSSNSLDMYWENLKGEPFGPRGLAAASTTYSAPALAVDKEGQRWYSVEGPNHRLEMYWENLKGEVFGPRTLAGEGTTYSAPALAVDKEGQRWYAVVGPNHSLDMYWENLKGEPFGPRGLAAASTTYSAPALAVDKEGQRWYSVEGPKGFLLNNCRGMRGFWRPGA